MSADFSMELLQARREWQKIFQVMRTRGLQPRLLHPARLSIKIEGQICLLYTSDAADDWLVV